MILTIVKAGSLKKMVSLDDITFEENDIIIFLKVYTPPHPLTIGVLI